MKPLYTTAASFNGMSLLSWQSIASSSDGSELAAVVADGYMYTSTDSGASWTIHYS